MLAVSCCVVLCCVSPPAAHFLTHIWKVSRERLWGEVWGRSPPAKLGVTQCFCSAASHLAPSVQHLFHVHVSFPSSGSSSVQTLSALQLPLQTLEDSSKDSKETFHFWYTPNLIFRSLEFDGRPSFPPADLVYFYLMHLLPSLPRMAFSTFWKKVLTCCTQSLTEELLCQ